MKLMKCLIKYITDENYRFLVNNQFGLYDSMNDSEFLKKMYKVRLGKELDFEDPQTFNEKLQWLKLNDRNPLYTQLVDKYGVKKYVSRLIGEEYIIPTLGVWEKFDDIDFDELPNKFVLKCTHDSGGLVICSDKNTLNKKRARKKLKKSLERNFFLLGREWPYKNVYPRIIAEQYIEDSELGELRDYKFFCFKGKVKCFKIDFDRFIDHHANYFSPDGELLRFGEVNCPPDYERSIEMPHTLGKMIELAERLSKNLPFVRVDFYEVDKKIYFGEITFYPASGFGGFDPKEWDYKLGEWITLPEKKYEC